MRKKKITVVKKEGRRKDEGCLTLDIPALEQAKFPS